MDFLPGTISIFSLCFQACYAVKVRTLDVPQVAIAGHSAYLTCDYHLEGQRLHQGSYKVL